MKKVAVVFKKEFPRSMKEKIQKEIKRAGFSISKDFDFVIVFGGDGTIFETEMSKARGKPILALNAGDLGFLTQGEATDIRKVLSAVKKNDFFIEERAKLYLSVNHKKQAEALNDIYITSAIPGKAIRVEVGVDTKNICSLICDGVLVSTPTGSTGYNISAGGSIIEPRCKVMSITPVNPHISSIKPIVIDDEHEIQIRAKQNTKIVGVIDGIKEVQIKPNALITIKKSKNTAKFIKIGKTTYFDKINKYFT